MTEQPGWFDLGERHVALSAAGDPLEQLALVVGSVGSSPGWPAALRCGADVQGPGAADALHALERPD
jgi:hypothetical protein